jgi:hypothetical protein
MLLALIIMATITIGLLFSGWFTPAPSKAQPGQPDPQPQIETTCITNWGNWQVDIAPTILAYGIFVPAQWIVGSGNTSQISAACSITPYKGMLVQYDQNNCSPPNFEDDNLGTITNVWTASGCGATPSSGTNTSGTASFTVNSYGTVTVTFSLNASDALNLLYSTTVTNTINVLQLKYVCEAHAPTNDTRTTIGIGEKVDFEVDGVPSGDTGAQYDWMIFQCSGSDDGSLSIYNAPSTTFTAPIIDAPNTETMSVWVSVDDPSSDIYGSQQIQYTVLTPTGVTPSIQNDGNSYNNYNFHTKGPPNNNIGAETYFQQLYTPTSVSFYNVNFRENIPYQTFTWPDGTLEEQDTDTNDTFTVDFDNTAIDDVMSFNSINRIFHGGYYNSFIFTITVPIEYLDDNNIWVACPPSGKNHPREYNGGDQTAKVVVQATSTTSGDWMGPYK